MGRTITHACVNIARSGSEDIVLFPLMLLMSWLMFLSISGTSAKVRKMGFYGGMVAFAVGAIMIMRCEWLAQ